MLTSVSISAVFNCSLERAFKTPFLSDISKVHTGYLFSPKVTHCTDAKNWGKPGHSKKVHVEKSLFTKAGYAFDDTILERSENNYWKIKVDNFQSPMMGFTKFAGFWKVEELESNRIKIEYGYEMHSKYILLYPFQWLFVKLFWRKYMKRVLENIRKMVGANEPYLYD